MPTSPITACSLCGLRFANRPLLEWHIREDHNRRPKPEERPSGPAAGREGRWVATKALLGHVGAPDRMAAELRRLRQRISDLEAALARLKDQHGAAAPPEHGPK